mmetsp:Transcript_43/g.125  ORF Transcript_43/g.125 Transcript_43/m.125 type:complete len:80 (-) Transcript_43:155-394(-)
MHMERSKGFPDQLPFPPLLLQSIFYSTAVSWNFVPASRFAMVIFSVMFEYYFSLEDKTIVSHCLRDQAFFKELYVCESR